MLQPWKNTRVIDLTSKVKKNRHSTVPRPLIDSSLIRQRYALQCLTPANADTKFINITTRRV